MTPYEELTSGEPMGPAMYALLVKLTQQSSRRYPPPRGYTSWSKDAAREWLHDYFIPAKGPLIAVKFLHAAVDDETLARLARKAIQNALIDEARATTAGLLSKRLEGLLPKHAIVDATTLYAGTPAWTLDEFGDTIYHGDWKDLLRDSRLKGIPPIFQLNSSGPTARPHVESLIAGTRGLLQAAGGALTCREMSEALVVLFELDDPAMYAIRDTDQDELDAASASPADDRPEVIAAADAIWDSLDADEQRLIGFLDDPVAIWHKVLRNRPDAQSVAERLRQKLQAAWRADPPPPGALEIVSVRSVHLSRSSS